MNKNIVLYEKKENCCGCWACKNICPKNAINMSEDEEGFFFPSINDDLCIGCGLCEQVCPMKKHHKNLKEEQGIPRIKIINFSMDDNYGAVIAGACLENFVKSITEKNIVETIGYDSSYTRKSFKKKIFSEAKPWIDLAKIFLNKLHIIKSNTSNASALPFKSTATKDCLKKHRYNKFRGTFLTMTSPSNDVTLEQCADNTTALICGSDIIWHPNLVKRNQANAFFLDFGGENIKRISYAASLDNADDALLKKYRKQYKKRLKNFDNISIRESCNVDFIQSVSKKDVCCCCDPVFLFDEGYFDAMIASSEEVQAEDRYIYVYVLSHNEDIAEYTKKLAKEKNLKIYYYSEAKYDFGKNSTNCTCDGPAEFLQRIKNAEYIVTTSFHCVAFSLIFKKKFVAFRRHGMGPKIDNILDIVDLSERLVQEQSSFDIDTPIDFKKINEALNKERDKSIKFLKDALRDF